MIILDTNVISEPLRTAPELRVVAWIDAQTLETLYLTAVTVGELRYGVAAMPAGRRRDLLAEQLELARYRCSPSVCWPMTYTRPPSTHDSWPPHAPPAWRSAPPTA